MIKYETDSPEPVTLSMGLVVKKRLEDSPTGGFIHARALER
jgi:hypothetical protein